LLLRLEELANPDQFLDHIGLNGVFRHPINLLQAAPATAVHDLVTLCGFELQIHRFHQSAASTISVTRHDIHMLREKAKRTVVAIAPVVKRHNGLPALLTQETDIFILSAHAPTSSIW